MANGTMSLGQTPQRKLLPLFINAALEPVLKILLTVAADISRRTFPGFLGDQRELTSAATNSKTGS